MKRDEIARVFKALYGVNPVPRRIDSGRLLAFSSAPSTRLATVALIRR